MRTVLAFTLPFEAAGPKALTQSPTAKTLALAVCVVVTVVDPVVVIVTFCVFGVAGFFVLAPLELVARKFPAPRSNPITDTVDSLTPVTFPDTTVRSASPGKRRVPPGNEGRVPPAPPGRKRKPPGPPKPPLVAPAPPATVHDPLAEGARRVMVRAATVVLEVLEAVPVTVTQSPAAIEPTDSVTVWVNTVVGDQFTVV